MDVHHRARGFTFLELVVVIVIVGVLSTYALFMWPASTLSVEAQAQSFANDIRYTQSLSMAHGQRYHIVKTSANTYQIVDSSSNAVTFPNSTTTATLNSGITFTAWNNLTNNLITFDGQGIPYIDTLSPGTALNLGTSYTITLSGGGVTATITVTPQTGMVTVT